MSSAVRRPISCLLNVQERGSWGKVIRLLLVTPEVGHDHRSEGCVVHGDCGFRHQVHGSDQLTWVGQRTRPDQLDGIEVSQHRDAGYDQKLATKQTNWVRSRERSRTPEGSSAPIKKAV